MHVALFTPRIVTTNPCAFLLGAPAETPHPIPESDIHAVFSQAVPPMRTLAQISIQAKFAPLAVITAIFPRVGAFDGKAKILSGLSKEKTSEIEAICSNTVAIIDEDVKCPRALFAVMEVSEIQRVVIMEVPYPSN